MKNHGIVISGPSGAGKSVIATRLCESDPAFQRARAITTRTHRDDDHADEYTYISSQEYDELAARNAFLVAATYRDNRYAILRETVEKIIKNNRVPVLTIAPSSVSQLVDPFDKQLTDDPTGATAASLLPAYLSFFLDTSDEELDRRLVAKGMFVGDE